MLKTIFFIKLQDSDNFSESFLIYKNIDEIPALGTVVPFLPIDIRMLAKVECVGVYIENFDYVVTLKTVILPADSEEYLKVRHALLMQGWMS